MFKLKDVVYKNIVNIETLNIPRNIVSFITGESGSGKTTLFKLLNNTIIPESGQVLFNNSDVISREDVLLVSGKVFLYRCSILENFKKFYNIRSIPMPNIEFIENILKLFNFDIDINNDVSNMSSGERLRIYTAIFLSFMPKVILLDEPTSALDAQTSTIVVKNVINFCKSNDIGVIIISHNADIIEKFSENTIYIKKECNE